MNNKLSELDVPALRALLDMKQQALAEAEAACQPHDIVYRLYQELKAVQVALTLRHVYAPAAGE